MEEITAGTIGVILGIIVVSACVFFWFQPSRPQNRPMAVEMPVYGRLNRLGVTVNGKWTEIPLDPPLHVNEGEVVDIAPYILKALQSNVRSDT